MAGEQRGRYLAFRWERRASSHEVRQTLPMGIILLTRSYRARLERVDNVPEPGITRARHKLRDAIPSVDELSSAVSRINSAPWEDPFALALGDTVPVEEEMVPTPIAGHDSPGNPQILNNSSSTPASDAVSENGEEESFVEIEERGDDKMRKIAKSLRPGDIVEEAHVSVDLFICRVLVNYGRALEYREDSRSGCLS